MLNIVFVVLVVASILLAAATGRMQELTTALEETLTRVARTSMGDPDAP